MYFFINQVFIYLLQWLLASDVYTVSGGEDVIRTEIYLNGPVEAAMYLYKEFYTYKSGNIKQKPRWYLSCLSVAGILSQVELVDKITIMPAVKE